MHCKRCGTELRGDDEFCYRCGNRTTFFQRLFSSKAVIGSLVAIVVVGIAAVLTWMIMSGRIDLSSFGKKSSEPNTNQIVVEEKKEPQKSEIEPETNTEEPIEEIASGGAIEEETFTIGDVTAEMAADTEFNNLLAKIKPYLAFSASFYADGSHAFRWDSRSASVATLYNLYCNENVVGYGTPMQKIQKKVKKEMKRLYGDKYEMDLTYGESYPDYVFVASGDTMVYNAVSIAGKKYKMDVYKVIAYKEGKYRVIIKAWLKNSVTKEDSDPQKYTVWVDKDETAEYGYTIRKVKLFDKKDKKI